jgi:hypothetical protein
VKRQIFNALLMVLAFVLGSLVTSRSVHVYAQGQNSPRLQAADLGSIPRAWGSLRGVSKKYLVFEDANGTIRMAFIDSGVHNFVQIERQ